MTTQQDVIKQFMASLDKTTLEGTAALDEAIKSCSNFNGIQDAIDHMIEDCKNSSSGLYFLRKYCGINLSNDDTGAISGSDAGGDKVKNAEDIVQESGEAVYPPSNTFTIRGLTVVVPDKSTLNQAEQRVVKGLYSWWLDGALKLIEESYGFSFNDNDKSNNTININLVYDPFTLASGNANTLNISMIHWDSLTDDDQNAKITGNIYADRIIAHELTHSIMDAAINIFYSYRLL